MSFDEILHLTDDVFSFYNILPYSSGIVRTTRDPVILSSRAISSNSLRHPPLTPLNAAWPVTATISDPLNQHNRTAAVRVLPKCIILKYIGLRQAHNVHVVPDRQQYDRHTPSSSRKRRYDTWCKNVILNLF